MVPLPPRERFALIETLRPKVDYAFRVTTRLVSCIFLRVPRGITKQLLSQEANKEEMGSNSRLHFRAMVTALACSCTLNPEVRRYGALSSTSAC